MRWAALLKGVNVGGNRKIPMAELRDTLEALGYTSVKTLLASGNVVFDAPERDAAKLEAHLEAEFTTRLGLETDFLLRDKPALAAVIAHDPFPDAARDDPSHMLVTFHREPFPHDALERLAATYKGPERLAARGRELYIDFAGSIGDSKLVPAMAKAKFPKCATARNWNTVNKLLALL